MAERPTGTVTFLFTDIEGSTRLWEDHPDRMPGALERHDEILGRVFAEHDGFVFAAGGDGFCVAFARADAAVEAAVAAQRSLGAEVWPEGGEIRVRMGLHTGESEERGGNYFGSVLNRVGRLHAVAHGGQVVVSDTTEPLVRGAVDLVDLGVHGLRDVAESSPVFQVVAEGLVLEFPPLRTVVSSAHNLPSAVDAFIGRDDLLVDLMAALGTSRLVTLIGVGGTGKTRLAVEAASRLLPEFVDGVWLAELAPISEAAAVPFVVGNAVGAVQQPGKSMLDSLVGSLANRNLLLVLDNCEHLLDVLVEAVESRCAGVNVLATSREGLGLRGEHLMAVGSMPAGDGAALFVARAQAAGTDVADSDPGVGRIVGRLDGLPLAIELAAARTRGLTVEEIEQRLAERFRLLRGSRRGRVERHQTLWNTVAWSHELLEPVERLVFDRLAVFAGGFTLDAAIAVCSTETSDEAEPVDGIDVEDAVMGLVDRSMVLAESSIDGTRYRLLETLRQFAETQLFDTDQIELFRGRHARWYAEFAALAGAGSKGVDGVVWNRMLRAEFDNYRAVIFGPDLASARSILASLDRWPINWEAFECIDWTLAVITPPAPEDAEWIGCVVWAAWMTIFVARSDDCATIVSDVEPDLISEPMLSFMWLNHHVNQALLARGDIGEFLEPMLTIATALDNDSDRVNTTAYVAYLAVQAGQLQLAADIWAELADDPARQHVPLTEPAVSFFHGFYLAAIGDPTAYERFETSRQRSVESGFTLTEHASGAFEVPLLIEQGELHTAQERITEAISHFVRAGSHLMLWTVLHSLATLLDETDHHDHALKIWAELRDRAYWLDPTQRADLETRLGPPGQPHLTDDELIAHASELIRQLT